MGDDPLDQMKPGGVPPQGDLQDGGDTTATQYRGEIGVSNVGGGNPSG